MRRSLFGVTLLLAASTLVAVPAAAQETLTPIFKSPYRSFQTTEFGVAFSDPGEGINYALEGFYGFGRDRNDFSLQGGFADTEGDTRVLIGGDFRTRILSYSETFPFDGALTVGFGANFGDGIEIFSVPVGVSLGRRILLEGSNTTFTPYLHPVLLPTFGDDEDVGFALGLGVDIKLSERFDLRVSGGLGDIEGVGVSFAFIQ